MTATISHHLDPRTRRVLTWVLAALVLVGLAVPFGLSALGRSGGAATSDASYSGSSAGSSPGSAEGGAAVESPGAPDAARDSSGKTASGSAAKPGTGTNGTSGTGSAAALAPKLARSAWLGIKVADLTGASARVRLIAAAAGGTVLTENVVTAADPTGGYGYDASKGAPVTGDTSGGYPGTESVPPVGIDEARMTLSVPAAKLDGVLTELSRVGTVSYRSSQSQDVSDTYADTQARIQPMRDSIERVRALLVKATDLQQIVLLESELTRRQSDLDSLTQRLSELDRRTTSSDVTVTLWTAATVTPEPTDNGFVSGLRTAWTSLLTSVTVIVTGLAVLLPWLLVGLVLAWVARRWWRARPRHADGGPADPSTPAAPASPPTA